MRKKNKPTLAYPVPNHFPKNDRLEIDEPPKPQPKHALYYQALMVICRWIEKMTREIYVFFVYGIAT